MAVLKFGSIVTDAAGKIGGHYFAHGQGGNILATNGTQLGRRDAVKKLWGYIRQATQSNSQLWQTLTDVERAAWAAEAPNWPAFNRVGDAVALRGYSLFMKVNGVLASVQVAPITTPAPKVQLSSITAITLGTVSPSTINVSGTFNVGTAEKLVIAATRSLSSARQPLPHNFRIIQYVNNGDLLPINIATNYKEIFGAPLTDGFLSVKAYIVDFTTGQQGVASYVKKIVS